ncbi:MAG: hypothetical protein CL693_05705 [Cellvibrionaceae bacterium]|nr:hypothetical protein [Cellvibrionaceae bacterium]
MKAKFCSQCGSGLTLAEVKGDHRPRLQCGSCGFVVYENPKILVSCFATWEKKILWMRRGTAPYMGAWAIPSGFLEEDESLQAGAARELYEETRAQVDTDAMTLYTVGSLVRMNQIYMVFRAPLLTPHFETTDEASEIKLFNQQEFPWQDFAFPEVDINVRQFYDELEQGKFGVYLGKLENGENIISQVQ